MAAMVPFDFHHVCIAKGCRRVRLSITDHKVIIANAAYIALYFGAVPGGDRRPGFLSDPDPIHLDLDLFNGWCLLVVLRARTYGLQRWSQQKKSSHQGSEQFHLFFPSSCLRRMSDRYSLKTSFTIRVLPGNIQHIGMRLAGNYPKAFQHVALSGGRFAVNPGPVRHDGLLGRQDALDSVEANVGLRGATAGRYFILQKDSQDLDAFERAIGRICQFQKKVSVRLDESKRKRFFFTTHRGYFFVVVRLRPLLL
jgi:hypothetical protein